MCKKLILVFLFCLSSVFLEAAQTIHLLNVSYDPTREYYTEINQHFSAYWKKKTGNAIEIDQSHGGSAKQARSVIDGLEADVVTLGLPYDIDMIAAQGLIAADWQKKLPHNSCPYTSTVVFLVKKGNPKQIKDWSDLVRSGVSVITSNPKTSAGGRWAYLAAWGFALKKAGEAPARQYMKNLYKNVPVLDSGARGSTTTFIERGIGDVLLCWENEAVLVMKQLGAGKFDMVVPSVSILAEPPVAVVDKIAKEHGTTQAAQAYLQFLYTDEAQEIAARHYYRPVNDKILSKYQNQFPKVSLFTVQDTLGGWKKATDTHFAEGGLFDQIYQPGK